MFSQNRIRKDFKTVFVMIFFFIVVVRIFIPASLNLQKYNSNIIGSALLSVGNYKENWEILTHEGIELEGATEGVKWSIPEPDNVKRRLNRMADTKIGKSNIKEGWKLIQQYFFMVVMVAGFINMAIPFAIMISIKHSYRVAVKRIIANTVKSLLTLTAMQIVLEKEYFIDFSKPVGKALLFVLLMTLFFNQDEALKTDK